MKKSSFMHSSTVILGVLLLRVGNDMESTELGIDLEDTQVCSWNWRWNLRLTPEN